MLNPGLGSKDVHHLSTTPSPQLQHSLSSGMGKRGDMPSLQLRKSDTASQVAKSSLPLGFNPIRRMLLRCVNIHGGDQQEQDVFPSSLVPLPSPPHKTTATIVAACTRLGECSDGLEISEGNWKTKLLSRSNSL